MRFFYKFTSILLTLIITFTVSACTNSKDAYIYFELPEVPTTLDPQAASTDSELMIVRNIFEGLLRKDKNGDIVEAVAQSYTKSGLTYTFELRKDAKWSNGEDLTAKDFVFGLKRAVNPETKSPFAHRLFAISNAKEIYEGLKGVDSLGVSASGTHSLKITLEGDDPHFLETLTTCVAMPCNESFFYETDGKYGIFSDKLIYNGSYKMSRWRKETFGIRLYKNDNYNGNFAALNAAVFITCDKDKDTLEQLKKNSIDIAFIDSTLVKIATDAELKTKEIENICWVLTLGNNFSNDMRKALSLLIGSEIYDSSLPLGYKTASSIFPESIEGEQTSSGLTFYDKEAGKSLYLKELKNFEEEKFPSDTVLYYYDNKVIKPVVTDIVGHWQNNLSAFVNIEAASSPELLISQLIDNTYSMSIFPVKASSTRSDEFLMQFGYDNNYNSLEEAQTEILKSNTIVPLMFQNTVIAYSPALTEIYSELGNGYIDFAYIVKEE